MDAQLKRGMLEGCVLAVLARGDSYGYRLVKEVGACVEISESTLYPILRQAGGVRGSLRVYARAHNGRLRKYYALTDAGRARLAELRAEWRQVLDCLRVHHGGNGGDDMNEREFLQANWKRAWTACPDAERRGVLEYYGEIIDDSAEERRRTRKRRSPLLGEAGAIARELRENRPSGNEGACGGAPACKRSRKAAGAGDSARADARSRARSWSAALGRSRDRFQRSSSATPTPRSFCCPP